MKVVENMEKSILSFIKSDHLLNIIQNQHVNVLIEIQEIIYCVFTDCIRKLNSE